MIPLMFLLGQQSDNNITLPPFASSGAYSSPCTYFIQPNPNNCTGVFNLYKDGGVINETGSQILNYGDSIEGGYYAGVIKINNKLYAIIVSPKSKQTHGKPINIQYSSKMTDLDNTSINDGYTNTQFMLTKSSSTFVAAHYVKTDLNDINFNGYNDWYIPSYSELEIVYRNLTPIATTPGLVASCNSDIYLRNIAGYNEFSYPCPTYKYTSLSQVVNPLFKIGGYEALTDSAYDYFSTSSVVWWGTEYGYGCWLFGF